MVSLSPTKQEYYTMAMHKYSTSELVAKKPSAEEFRRLPRKPIIFILHNIRSLENVGLFFRLADAVLAEKIYITGYTGYPRVENKAQGTENRGERIIRHAEKEINKTAIKLVPFVPWEKQEDVLRLIDKLKSGEVQVVGVEQTDESIDYTLASYRLPLALIFGHEREGLEEKLLEKCDFVVHVSMLGMGNSHNVAMAGTIISYHLIRVLLK